MTLHPVDAPNRSNNLKSVAALKLNKIFGGIRYVDGEHGGHTVTTILDIARAVAAYDVTPVVRIPQAGTGIIKQLLDGGIQNIIIPKVETGEETESIMYPAANRKRARLGKLGRHNQHSRRRRDLPRSD